MSVVTLRYKILLLIFFPSCSMILSLRGDEIICYYCNSVTSDEKLRAGDNRL